MKHLVEASALVPTCVVAMVVLAGNATLYSFIWKVAVSYVFFWFLAAIFWRLWRVVASAPRTPGVPSPAADHESEGVDKRGAS